MGAQQPVAKRRVRESFDRGVNYYDVSPGYGDANIKLVPALDGIRNQVFPASHPRAPCNFSRLCSL